VSVSSTSTTSSLGGMLQCALDGGRAMMDSGRAVASSDAVAAPMVGLVRGLTLIFLFRRWVGGRRWR
jgi:hypothetical protein